jgi:hypothetical protein
MLDLLAPNNNKVTACWLAPEAGGNTDRVYVYQGDNYIGEAFDIAGKRYNECKAEQTDEDRANFEFQCRHIAKYRKWEREKKDRLPKVLRIKASAAKAIGKTLEEESPSYIVEEPVRLDNAINIDLATVQEDYSDMEERAKNY